MNLTAAILLQSALEQGQLYALLNGTASDELYALSADAKEGCCLYQGRYARDYTRGGPHLIKVDNEGRLRLQHHVCGTHWGYFLISAAPFEKLRQHFRKFIEVQDSQGQTQLFRFYDPRLVGAFINASTPNERQAFFGPVQHIIGHSAFMQPCVYSAEAVAERTWHWPIGQRFIFRPEHEQAFKDQSTQIFVRRLVAYAYQLKPQQTLSPEALQALAYQAVQQGEGYGFTDGQTLERYFQLYLVLGADFEQHYPRVKALLERPSQSAKSKLDSIFKQLNQLTQNTAA